MTLTSTLEADLKSTSWIQLCTDVARKWCCLADSMLQHKLKTAVHSTFLRLLSPKKSACLTVLLYVEHMCEYSEYYCGRFLFSLAAIKYWNVMSHCSALLNYLSIYHQANWAKNCHHITNRCGLSDFRWNCPLTAQRLILKQMFQWHKV